MNLPNFITLTRIGCVPLFLWILSSTNFHAVHGRQELAAAAVFLLASASDGLDGLLARRTGQVTTLGTLLSSLADKLLVSAGFIALVRFAPGLVPAWIVVLIVGREFLVTGLQAVAVQEKMGLGVRDLGKSKTVLQTISVLALLAAHGWPQWRVGGVGLPGSAIAVGLLWLMLGVSLTSAVIYFRAFWVEALQRSRRRRAPLPFVSKRAGDSDVSA